MFVCENCGSTYTDPVELCICGGEVMYVLIDPENGSEDLVDRNDLRMR
jgi:hypothetical protein